MYQGDVWNNHWIPQFCQFPAFMNRVKEIWNDFYNGDFKNIYTFIDNHEKQIKSAVTKDGQRWTQYKMSDFAGCIDKTTERLRKNAEWLNSQWGDGNNNGGNNGNGNNGNNGNTDYPENPEFYPSDVTAMYVWQNGKQVAYDIAKVDSITFQKQEAKGIVIKAKVPSTWTKTIYVWVWGDEIPEGQNEQIAMRQGDWFVYVHKGNSVNIIFKNGQGWTGHPNQSENIENLTKSACYILTQEGSAKAQFTEVDCE
jgi:hypothetical protein